MTSEFERKIRLLKAELKRKIFQGVSRAYNQEIIEHFANHPTGIGVTLQHFKELSVDGNKSQQTIAVFDKGYPAILQLGTGSRAGYKYPYNKTFGTFISFSEEPNLEEWARKNYPGFNSKLTGLRVGKEDTTRFGRPYNQWVFRAGDNMKKNKSKTKATILQRLREIKLK